MHKFISKEKLFELSLSEGWKWDYEEGVYSFINADELHGVLYITCYYFEDLTKRFDLDFELQRGIKKHPTAHIVSLSEYGAKHFGINSLLEEMLQYYWITGSNNIKLFCSITMYGVKMNRNWTNNI